MSPDPAAALDNLRYLFSMEEDLRRRRLEIMQTTKLPRDQREAHDELLARQLGEWEETTAAAFRQILTFLPHLVGRHQEALDKFHAGGSFERSVFVMTKYPDPSLATDPDKQLRRVIDEVKKAVDGAGFVPRLAADHEYHEMLWPNVELYLLGCH